MEPWRPAKDKWCRIVFNDGPGQRYHGDGLAGLILGASKQSDSFLNGEGRRCFLAHITPGGMEGIDNRRPSSSLAPTPSKTIEKKMH